MRIGVLVMCAALLTLLGCGPWHAREDLADESQLPVVYNRGGCPRVCQLS